MQADLVVAVYASHADAARALRTVQGRGFDMRKWSIMGKDVLADERSFGFYSAGDAMKFWAGRGAIWRDVWGMLVGGGFFFIPPIGPLVVMGPLVSWVVDALETAPLGEESAVPAEALKRIGVPLNDLEQRALDVTRGRFLIVAQCAGSLVESARSVLASTGATQLSHVYNPQPTMLDA